MVGPMLDRLTIGYTEELGSAKPEDSMLQFKQQWGGLALECERKDCWTQGSCPRPLFTIVTNIYKTHYAQVLSPTLPWLKEYPLLKEPASLKVKLGGSD